jgi:negative regulator of flagellin synthesis FlgM|tara:strand:+ start:4348 stop:4659 length:312 start_codon:yes stop_codon:yes gene_type:complete
MIDQIKNNINSLNNANSNKTNVESRKTNTEVKKVNQSNSKPENDSSAVSRFVSREKIKDMASEPPIDKASTSRIKNAIANGTYPIDLNKIADALFDAYKEMKD